MQQNEGGGRAAKVLGRRVLDAAGHLIASSAMSRMRDEQARLTESYRRLLDNAQTGARLFWTVRDRTQGD